MAVVPIKFRCYRCNQLLGVARSKAGGVVACPKCSAELVVPQPSESSTGAGGESVDDPVEAAGGTAGPSPNAAGKSDVEANPLLELLNIRPEDIRVEPGSHWEPALVREAIPAAAPPRAEPAPEAVEPPRPAPPLPPPQPVQSYGAPLPVESIVPPIRIDAPGPSTISPRALPARARDLVLPRTVVTAWSLFVLLALTFAFLAGLLAGHFVWKVH
jgi:phage FluMu protein Com